MSKLTFEEFNRANIGRQTKFLKDATEWSISDAFMAAIGELGEMANAMKKVRRAELGMLNKNKPGRQIDSLDDARAEIAGEIGGFMCYLDQIAHKIGLNLEDCITDEFNKKSEELDLPERLINGEFRLQFLQPGMIGSSEIKNLQSIIKTDNYEILFCDGDEFLCGYCWRKADSHSIRGWWRTKDEAEQSAKTFFNWLDVEMKDISDTKAPNTPMSDVAGIAGAEIQNMELGSDGRLRPINTRKSEETTNAPINQKQDLDRLQLQRDEFDAVRDLMKDYNRLPPVVDDDYPYHRGHYERSVESLLRALRANGRKFPE